MPVTQAHEEFVQSILDLNKTGKEDIGGVLRLTAKKAIQAVRGDPRKISVMLNAIRKVALLNITNKTVGYMKQSSKLSSKFVKAKIDAFQSDKHTGGPWA